jgi:arabinose-5-phosphate isomerase
MSTDEDMIIKIARRVMVSESQSIARAGKKLDCNFVKAISCILNSHGNVVITGMGKSGDIAKKIASTFSSIGVFSYFLHPSDALHGDLGRLRDDDVIIIISHSGETEELILLLEKIRDFYTKHKLIIITSNPKSTLAKCADIKILTHVKNEVRIKGKTYFLTPTISTTVALALGDAMACALQEINGFQPLSFKKNHPGGHIGHILCDL